MSKLQVTARLKIKEGKLNEFKDLAVQCLVSTKDKDPGTVQYDWFFNESQTECVVRETYTDSNSVFAHLANLGDLFEKILQTADMSLEVYGNPSEELRKATEGMNPKIYPFYQGL